LSRRGRISGVSFSFYFLFEWGAFSGKKYGFVRRYQVSLESSSKFILIFFDLRGLFVFWGKKLFKFVICCY
jgi:hypothetical protein